MPRGLSKIRQINEENAAKKAAYEAGGGGFRYLSLQPGQTVKIRFLEQGEDVAFFWMHELPKQPSDRVPQRTPCLDQEDTGVACPGCERGIKRSSQVVVNVIWYDAPKFQRDAQQKIIRNPATNEPVVVGTEDTVAVWKTGPTNGGRLEFLDTKYGGLVGHLFSIHRQGAGKDDTKYMIDLEAMNAAPTAQDVELIKGKYDLSQVMKPLSYGDMARIYSGGQPVQQSTPTDLGRVRVDVIYGPYPAVVLSWHDGDTCHLELDLGFGIHALGFNLRVFGINAPELSTEAGKAALAAADEICPPGTPITVLSHSWDKYGGRFDGEITLPDGSSYGERMLESGNAVLMT